MIDKLVPTELQESMDHEKANGGFNDMPAQFREITEKEFAQSMFFSYTPKKMEFRQITRFFNPEGFLLKNGKCMGMIEVRLFYFHDDTGVGISSDFWGGKILYFAFGCKHEYKEIPKKGLFRCQHYYKCEKCGHEMLTDSSD
jgi:DNA-directed RNA polymerase subunit RPC12/RpoP